MVILVLADLETFCGEATCLAFRYPLKFDMKVVTFVLLGFDVPRGTCLQGLTVPQSKPTLSKNPSSKFKRLRIRLGADEYLVEPWFPCPSIKRRVNFLHSTKAENGV